MQARVCGVCEFTRSPTRTDARGVIIFYRGVERISATVVRIRRVLILLNVYYTIRVSVKCFVLYNDDARIIYVE